jgi:predicted nucleotide-binding protein
MRLTNDAIVNVFDRGTFNVQGRNIEEVQAALGVPAAPAAVPAAHASLKT